MMTFRTEHVRSLLCPQTGCGSWLVTMCYQEKLLQRQLRGLLLCGSSGKSQESQRCPLGSCRVHGHTLFMRLGSRATLNFTFSTPQFATVVALCPSKIELYKFYSTSTLITMEINAYNAFCVSGLFKDKRDYRVLFNSVAQRNRDRSFHWIQ